MGLKRAFDEEGLQELSFKHPKQLDSNALVTSVPEINNSCGASQKTTSLSEINPSYGAFQKTDIPGNLSFNDIRLLCQI